MAATITYEKMHVHYLQQNYPDLYMCTHEVKIGVDSFPKHFFFSRMQAGKGPWMKLLFKISYSNFHYNVHIDCSRAHQLCMARSTPSLIG